MCEAPWIMRAAPLGKCGPLMAWSSPVAITRASTAPEPDCEPSPAAPSPQHRTTWIAGTAYLPADGLGVTRLPVRPPRPQRSAVPSLRIGRLGSREDGDRAALTVHLHRVTVGELLPRPAGAPKRAGMENSLAAEPRWEKLEPEATMMPSTQPE